MQLISFIIFQDTIAVHQRLDRDTNVLSQAIEGLQRRGIKVEHNHAEMNKHVYNYFYSIDSK